VYPVNHTTMKRTAPTALKHVNMPLEELTPVKVYNRWVDTTRDGIPVQYSRIVMKGMK
jgi:hypothetical protein